MRGHIRKYHLKAGDKLWAAVIYQGKRFSRDGKLKDCYRWVRGFKTEKAAQAELTRILRSINDESYVEPTKQNLGEYLLRWLNSAKPNLAPKTFERYEQLVEVNINPKLGPVKLSKLHPQQLAEFYTWLGTSGNRRTGLGLHPQTVLHIHRLLRKALQQAVVWQLRATNPADAVDAPRVPEREMQPIEEERAALLIEAAQNTDMFLPILIGFCTGMRRGEVLALRWADLDLEHARLTVNQSLTQTRAGGIKFKSPKNKSSRRTMALPMVLIDAFKVHRGKQENTKDLFGPDYASLDLVLPLPDGSPWPPDRFTDAYTAFARRNGAKGIRFHDLRHTHASELLRRGTPIKTVSARLGHSGSKITIDTYGHLMTGDDEQAAKTVQKVYGKRKPNKGVKKEK
jgi:integrase